MLVLTRKLMEKLYIGDEICVTIVRVEGSQVRLGIEAPRQIPVVRAELRNRPAVAGAAAEPASQAEALKTPPVAPRGTGIRRRGPSR
jgi:carbon storage regulator